MAHFGISIAVADHLNLLAVLCQGNSESSELTASVLEVNLSVELFGSINLEAVSGTIVTVSQLVDVVLPASTCAVAIIVKTFARRGIA